MALLDLSILDISAYTNIKNVLYMKVLNDEFLHDRESVTKTSDSWREEIGYVTEKKRELTSSFLFI
jgi:hypothetical protein